MGAIEARERADRDCEVGLANLALSVETASEYIVSDDATGKRLVVPQRAMLAGMVGHLGRSMAIERARRTVA